MAENNKKPRIRFKGFTEEWEQRKLGDITEITKGQQINKSKLGDSGVYYVLNGGMSPSGYTDTFNTKANTISISEGGNSCGYVNYNFEPFWSGGHNYTLLNPKIDAVYLYQVLKLIEPQIMALRVGSGLPNIQKSRLQEVEITFPREEEQKKIGAYFEKLDNLITLHQRKYDKLVNVKKALLEKMFPKNGKNIPEIRFKGFFDAWEQRKLGDIAIEMIAGGDVDKELILEEGRYPVIANALTNDGIVGFYNNEFRIKAPAVTITGRGDVGHAKARIVDFTPVVRLLSIKSKHDVFFLENAINTLKIVVESTGVPQLTVPQLEKYEVVFPKQLAEEEKIGAFFKQLDNLITLHQRECEKLKNIKKSLLEKMFV